MSTSRVITKVERPRARTDERGGRRASDDRRTTGLDAGHVTEPEGPEGGFDIGIRFAAWLDEGLRTRGISQRHLAYRSGVSHSAISRLLSGERGPSLGTANRLAIVLGWESLLEALR